MNISGEISRQQRRHVHRHRAQRQVERVKSRRGDPFDILGGMMDRVVFPEKTAMEQAVYPIKREIRRHQIDDTLGPKRQAADRAMAVIVEFGDRLAVGEAENHDGAQHRHPDAHVTGEDRREYPVGEIGAQAALFPPWLAAVAGRNQRQNAEHHPHRRQPGQDVPQGQHELPAGFAGKLPTHQWLTRRLVIFWPIAAKVVETEPVVVRS